MKTMWKINNLPNKIPPFGAPIVCPNKGPGEVQYLGRGDYPRRPNANLILTHGVLSGHSWGQCNTYQ